MAKAKTTKAKAEEKVEPKAKAEEKVEPKEKATTKKAEPKVDKNAFIARKMRAINLMDNAFLAERQAERIMSRR